MATETRATPENRGRLTGTGLSRAHSPPKLAFTNLSVSGQEPINKTFTSWCECVARLTKVVIRVCPLVEADTETGTQVPWRTSVCLPVFMCVCVCFSTKKMESICSFQEYTEIHSTAVKSRPSSSCLFSLGSSPISHPLFQLEQDLISGSGDTRDRGKKGGI